MHACVRAYSVLNCVCVKQISVSCRTYCQYHVILPCPFSSRLDKFPIIALYNLVAALFTHQPRRVISENHWLRLHADGRAYTAAEQADAHTRYAALMRAVRTYRRSLYDRVGDRALMDVLRELGADEMKMPAIQVGVRVGCVGWLVWGWCDFMDAILSIDKTLFSYFFRECRLGIVWCTVARWTDFEWF